MAHWTAAWLLVLAMFILFVSCGGGCPQKWKEFKGKCYLAVHKRDNQTVARKECKSMGANIVIINSSEESDFVNRLFGPGNYYIGLSRIRHGTSSIFEWEDSSPLSFTNWEPNQPRGTNRGCVIAKPKWSNVYCSTITDGFVCSSPQVPHHRRSPDALQMNHSVSTSFRTLPAERYFNSYLSTVQYYFNASDSPSADQNKTKDLGASSKELRRKETTTTIAPKTSTPSGFCIRNFSDWVLSVDGPFVINMYEKGNQTVFQYRELGQQSTQRGGWRRFKFDTTSFELRLPVNCQNCTFASMGRVRLAGGKYTKAVIVLSLPVKKQTNSSGSDQTNGDLDVQVFGSFNEKAAYKGAIKIPTSWADFFRESQYVRGKIKVPKDFFVKCPKDDITNMYAVYDHQHYDNSGGMLKFAVYALTKGNILCWFTPKEWDRRDPNGFTTKTIGYSGVKYFHKQGLPIAKPIGIANYTAPITMCNGERYIFGEYGFSKPSIDQQAIEDEMIYPPWLGGPNTIRTTTTISTSTSTTTTTTTTSTTTTTKTTTKSINKATEGKDKEAKYRATNATATTTTTIRTTTTTAIEGGDYGSIDYDLLGLEQENTTKSEKKDLRDQESPMNLTTRERPAFTTKRFRSTKTPDEQHPGRRNVPTTPRKKGPSKVGFLLLAVLLLAIIVSGTLTCLLYTGRIMYEKNTGDIVLPALDEHL